MTDDALLEIQERYVKFEDKAMERHGGGDPHSTYLVFALQCAHDVPALISEARRCHGMMHQMFGAIVALMRADQEEGFLPEALRDQLEAVAKNLVVS